MNPEHPEDEVLPVKDETREGPIPTAWRQTFREIVAALRAGDFRLERGVRGVRPVTAETADQIEGYLRQYGATLVELPDATWESSVCIWTGDHWDTLVDLWTREEGRSDLVLHARVVDIASGFSVELHLVYVP